MNSCCSESYQVNVKIVKRFLISINLLQILILCGKKSVHFFTGKKCPQ